PRFYVSRQCSHFIEEIKGLKRNVDVQGNVTYTGTDHAIDPVRYIINAQPRPPALTESDMASMDSTTRLMARTHSNWAARWDKAIRKSQDGAVDYFEYLRFFPP